MADDKMNMELGVSVKTDGTEKLTDLDKMLLRIKAAQDRYNSTLGKGGSAQAKAAKEALQGTQERMRVLRMQFAYQNREQNNLAREEQRSIREAGRLRSQENRRALAEARELNRERDRAVSRIGRGATQVRGGATRIAGLGAAAAAASTYAAQRTVDTLTRSAVTIDDAIVAAQVHIFGEQNTATSRKSAEALRKKLMPVASKLGTKTADLMGAYVEAAQAGVADDLLDITVEQGTKYAKLNKLNVPDVLEQSGYALNGLKAFGAVTADIVKKYYDETSFLIATTSANRKELLSFTRTGLASGASIGMNMSETLAFGGAVTAAGGEGQQASRMLSTQGTRIADWRNRGRNILSKHHRDANDRQFLDAVQILGYRDSDAMADSFSRDFFGSLVNAQDKLKGISDPLKRKSITGQLFGKEFGALIDSMIMGGNMREFRGKLDGAGGYLNRSWDKFTGNMGFILDRIGVVMSNLSESMGLALKPIWVEVSAFIDRFKGFDRAGDAVRSFTDGLLRGFGADSVTTLLTRMIGDPAAFQLNLRTFFLAGKGLAEGLTSVATGIKSLLSAFAGPNADAQAMGKLTGQILALSAALTVAAPALVVLGSLTAILRGLGAAGAGVAGLLGGGARAAGAAGTAAGAGAMGAAILTKAGQLIGLAFLAEVAQHFNVLKMDSSKGLIGNLLEEFVPAPLRRWLDSDKGQSLGQGQGWQDVGPSKRLEEMRESIDKNTAEVKRNTQATQDDVKKAAETKAAELKAEESKRLSELVSVRNGAMSGSVGGGSSTVDDLRRRGFTNIVGEGGGAVGGGVGSAPMPQGNLGNGVTAPRDSGDVNARARQAYDYFISRGYSPQAAAGIIASLKQESNFTAGSRGDGGKAHGIAQWHADRRANIMRNTGINISTASFGQQLKALDWEMRSGDAGAQRARRILMTPGVTARQAGAAFVKHFERPLRNEESSRGAVAEGYYRKFGAGSGSPPAASPSPTAQAQGEAQKAKELANGIQARPTPPGASPGPVGTPSQPGSGPQSMLSVPQSAPAPKSITSGVPQGAGRRNGGAGGGVTVNIAAVHGGDPKSNGEEVGKQVRSAVNSSYIDVDGYGYA